VGQCGGRCLGLGVGLGGVVFLLLLFGRLGRCRGFVFVVVGKLRRVVGLFVGIVLWSLGFCGGLDD